ncbi:hypothetical protein JCM18905_3625 [Vibrio sp. JCM 18905]|nr:hypothetical protein JCM18905_3625 [Vibrio sp. JCM 18905]
MKKMCEIFAKQPPQDNYQFITRSIRIDGHATSVKLEASFWTILEEIANAQNMTVPKFISTVYQEALEYNGEVNNFAPYSAAPVSLTLANLKRRFVKH